MNKKLLFFVFGIFLIGLVSAASYTSTGDVYGQFRWDDVKNYSADWNEYQGNLFYNGGNLGLGIYNPTSKLQVIGNINATGIYYGDGSGITGISGSQITNDLNWINASQAGNLNVSNADNANKLDGYDSSYFMPLNKSVYGDFDFNGGWTNGGVSIVDGNLYAQSGYFYDINSLAVSTLEVNGSMIPPQGFDNQFDIGNSSLRWRNGYFGGTVTANAFVGDGSGLTNLNDSAVNYWKKSGNDVYYDSGNVGVGVNKKLYFYGTSGAYITEGGDTVLRIYNNDGEQKIALPVGGGESPLILNPNGGDVGIGTSSPSANLQVSAPSDVKLRLEDQAISGATWDWFLDNWDGVDNFKLKLMYNNTNNIMTFDKDGQVGIGTTSPGAALEVSGGSGGWAPTHFRIKDSDTEVGLNLQNTGTGGRSYSVFSTMDSSGQGGGKFVIADATAGANRFTIDSNGDIGVGDSSPDGSLKLDVEGQVGATEYCDETGANCKDIVNVLNSSDVNTKIWTYGYSPMVLDSNNYLFTVDTYGNGDRAYAIIRFYDGTANQYRQVQVVIKDAGGTNVISVYPVLSSGGSNVNAEIRYMNRAGDPTKTDFFITRTGTMSYGQYVEVQGQRLISDSSNSETSSLTSINLNSNLHIDVDGNVGIGKSNPGYKLDVVGDVNAYNLRINGTAITPGANVSGAGTTNYVAKFTSGGTVGNSVIYDDGSKVGIGTSSPSDMLDIRPISYSSNQDGGIRLATTGGQWPWRIALKSSSGGTPRFAIDTYTTQDALTMIANGNVGIGTENPTAKLAVSGSSYQSNYGYLMASFTDTTNAPTFINMKSSGSGYGVNIGVDGNDFIVGDPNAGTFSENLRVKQNGNVGIGVTDPQAKLHVDSEIAIGPAGSDYTTLKYGSPSNGGFQIHNKQGSVEQRLSMLDADGTYGSSLIYETQTTALTPDSINSGAVKFIVRDSGNVGIGGVTDPSEKLEVSGSAKVTGSMIIGQANITTEANGDVNVW